MSERRQFGPAAIALVYAYGLFLAVPVLAGVAAMTLAPASLPGLLMPLAGLALSALILPLGQGNLHVRRIVKRLASPAVTSECRHFIVQITFAPRLRTGLRGLLETADDVGILRVEKTGFSFQGDSVECQCPAGSFELATADSIGWRGLHVYSRPSRLVLHTLGGEKTCEIAERESLWLPSSYRIMREMRVALEQVAESAGIDGDDEQSV